jgi:uncharacterized protein (TIGR03083 family)
MPSKAELRERLEQARARFDASVEGIETARLETQAVCGVWTSADVAGHLADWNIELLAIADHATGGATPARPVISSFDEFNASHADARKDQPWPDVRSDLDATFDDVFAALDRYSDEQLAVVTPFPWGGEGPVVQVFQIAAGHVAEHTEDLEHHLSAS